MDGRVFAGVVAGCVIAALSGVFLGEYEFEGWLPFLAGPLLGLLVAEVMVTLGRVRALPVAIVAMVATAAALIVAGWIDASRGVEDIKIGAWIAAGLGALFALGRATRWRADAPMWR